MTCKRLDPCGGFEKGKDPRRNPMMETLSWTISYYLKADADVLVTLLLLFSVFTWQWSWLSLYIQNNPRPDDGWHLHWAPHSSNVLVKCLLQKDQCSALCYATSAKQQAFKLGDIFVRRDYKMCLQRRQLDSLPIEWWIFRSIYTFFSDFLPSP